MLVTVLVELLIDLMESLDGNIFNHQIVIREFEILVIFGREIFFLMEILELRQCFGR
jgi:hypothetical protein